MKRKRNSNCNNTMIRRYNNKNKKFKKNKK